ncbi:MAG: hypothetical protein NZ849_08275 [Meiothermus sp.]|uniref:hypothetical protein n=1 Tax=Meiothermus sp. TaxID=1955249 RepID=UPI0025CEF36D|nr:hypothetical protein [Meiothermus sp.]MCS7194888.1 hypothetical protein [Meiothermus sp.]MDW8091258.1 hypothetical protein [Meiothermus sp.]
MGKYDDRLARLDQAEIVARLEGAGGLLAFSSRELHYLDDTSTQSARLSEIKRISTNKQTGNIEVMGSEGLLMSFPSFLFQKEELRIFLESLRNQVLKAKSEPAQPLEPPPPAEEASPPAPSIPVQAPPPPQPQEQIHLAEPPKTLPDEPGDPPWAPTARPGPATALSPTPPPQSESPPMPTKPSTTGRAIPILLKLSALLTAAVTAGYLVVHMGTTDIWIPLGVTAIGLALSLIQWRLSEPL